MNLLANGEDEDDNNALPITLGKGYNGLVIKEWDAKYGSVAVKYFTNIETKEDKNKIQNEANILFLLGKLNEAYIYPGKIFLLKTNIYNKNTLNPFIMLSLHDITLYDFREQYHSKHIYKSIIFQIIVQLIVFQKYLLGYHGDLHSQNILIKYVDKKLKIRYRINGITYIIPTYGIQASISDFSESVILKTPEKSDLRKLSVFWQGIVYNSVNKTDIRKNKYVMDALALLRKEKHNISGKEYRKIWHWYDRTQGKGIVDYKLFLYLLNNSFDYTPLLDEKNLGLINYLIVLLKNVGITGNLVNLAELNLKAFGYDIINDTNPVDFTINYS